DLIAPDRDYRPYLTGPEATGGLREYGVEVAGTWEREVERALAVGEGYVRAAGVRAAWRQQGGERPGYGQARLSRSLAPSMFIGAGGSEPGQRTLPDDHTWQSVPDPPRTDGCLCSPDEGR